MKSKDLNPITQNGPFIAIAQNNEDYVYAIEVKSDVDILGLFMDPQTVNFVDLRQILSLLNKSDFLVSITSIHT